MLVGVSSSLMALEAKESPRVIERLLKENAPVAHDLGGYLRRHPPQQVLTIARGSSDHAALFGKYVIETHIQVICASLAPSVFTIYGAVPRVRGSLMLAVSQSGQSPDLLEVVRRGRSAGALTVALVNQEESPLAEAAELVLPLWAGEEKAVAATKSYLAALVALAQLVAHWKDDTVLKEALERLPEAMYKVAEIDRDEGLEVLAAARDALVVGRGYGYAVAQEWALKLKETSAIHAEAMSGAELLHGPMALIEPGFPVLILAPKDEPLPGLLELADYLKQAGARLLVASSEAEALERADLRLVIDEPLHPVLDPVLLTQAFYPFAARLATARGLDPDNPRHLHKITRTR